MCGMSTVRACSSASAIKEYTQSSVKGVTELPVNLKKTRTKTILNISKLQFLFLNISNVFSKYAKKYHEQFIRAHTNISLYHL